MYTKIIKILLLILLVSVITEGLPEVVDAIRNILPDRGHSSQYNLFFWILVLIGVFSMLKNSERNKRS